MALWIKLLGFMKSVNIKFAAFVLMLRGMATALAPFFVVMGVILTMFAHLFYFRNSEIDASEFGFHDDGAPTPFYPLATLYKSLFLLAFVGDFDADAFPTDWDICLLVSFIVLVVIIMMNVLIAIVSDEYDRCMAMAYELYWTERWKQVSQASLIYPALPEILLCRIDRRAVYKVVEKELKDSGRMEIESR